MLEGLLFFGVVWCGVVWLGVVRCGFVWCVAGCQMWWNCFVMWCGIVYNFCYGGFCVAWYNKVFCHFGVVVVYGMAWSCVKTHSVSFIVGCCDMAVCGMVWFGVFRCALLWCSVLLFFKGCSPIPFYVIWKDEVLCRVHYNTTIKINIVALTS